MVLEINLLKTFKSFKLRSCLFLFIFVSPYLYAQPSKKLTDSIYALTLNQNNKIALSTSYLNLANAYILSGTNIKKGIYFSKKGFNIATEVNYNEGIATYYLLKSKIAYYKGVDFESELYAKKAMSIFKKTKNFKGYLETAYFYAMSTSGKYEYSKSINIVVNILKKYEKIEAKREIGLLNLAIGILYSRSNEQDSALKYLNKAFSIFIKNKNNAEIAICYNEFGLIYIINEQYETAIKYIKKALLVSENSNICMYNKALIYSFLSEAYTCLGRYEKAILINKKTLQIYREYESEDNITNCLNGIATNFYYKKDYIKAKNTCNEIITKHSVSEFKIDAILLLGEIQHIEKKYEKAIGYYNLVLNELDKYPEKNIEQENYRWVYEDLALAYKAINNYKKALEYQIVFSTINSRVFQKEKDKRINQLQAEFESHEKDIALKTLTIEKQKKEIELQKQSRISFVTCVILILLIPLILTLSFYYSAKNKLNLILTKKNKDLSQMQMITQQALTEKEVLLKEIHHRVKNNLQLVMSILNIQASDKENTSIEGFIEKGQSRIASMVLIHENLYQKEDIGNINFETYAETLVKNIRTTFGEISDRIDVYIKMENVFFDIQTSIPLGLIINELVTNSFKHAFPNMKKGTLNVSIYKDEQSARYVLEIADDGVGFATKSDHGKSIGLELVSLLVMQLNGSIILETIVGTRHIIYFDSIN